MADRYDYVLVGNGMAGVSAAQELRRIDAKARILLIGDEGEPYYYRAALSEWVAGEVADDAVYGRTPDFYDQLRIEQLTDRVSRLDAKTKRIYLESGTTLQYGQTLIATGARANVYPVEGLDHPTVFRTLADARGIKVALRDCGKGLIVGGGILGLELAGALFRMGQRHDIPPPEIAVVQRSDHVGKPLLDAHAAEWLQAIMLAHGVELFFNDTVQRVEGTTAHLTSGRSWDFDRLVQAVGITPVYPEVPGLEVGRGIRIDPYSRTNLPDVYAAGDGTETLAPGSDRWRTTRIWLDCARQAKIAACYMAGGERARQRAEAVQKLPFFNASVIYTVNYTFIGQPHDEGGETLLWQADDGYRKLRVLDGKLAGALLLGQRHGTMSIFGAIGQPVSEFGDDIVRPDFPWNDLGGSDWDYTFY